MFNFTYYITIAVLFIMLIGSNHKLKQQRIQLKSQDELMLTTARILNERMDLLRLSLVKSENNRKYLLGLWREAMLEGRIKVYD